MTRVARCTCLLIQLLCVTNLNGSISQQADSELRLVSDQTQPERSGLDYLLVDDDEVLLRFKLIAPGKFIMGNDHHSPLPDQPPFNQFVGTVLWESSRDEGPQRTTTITSPYYLAHTKISTGLFCRFLNAADNAGCMYADNKYSRITKQGDTYVPKDGCSDLAANVITYRGAVEFAKWLSDETGRKFRLPTEAEWTFAAQGPEDRRYPWGDVACVDVCYGGYIYDESLPLWLRSHRLGSSPANATPDGILDMVGPTAEWTSDFYTPAFDLDDTVDPKGPPTGSARVLKGRESIVDDRESGSLHCELDAGIYGLRLLLETVPITKD